MSEQELRLEIIAIVDELYEARLITPTGGNVSEAAAILVRNPSALHRLMKKLAISSPRRRR